MSWDLRKARNKFLARHRFAADRSFWWYVARSLRSNASDDEIVAMLDDYLIQHRDLLMTAPTRSNCPAVAIVVDDVIGKTPAEWKAIVRNVFVGLTLTPDVNAEAWVARDAGVIEISLQYLWAFESYASAFDEFAYAMTRILDGDRGRGQYRVPTGSDYGNVRALWTRLDRGTEEWRDPDAIRAGTDDLVRLAPGRRTEDFDLYMRAAQEFIVCHEAAHHVLGHTAKSARRRAQRAAELVAPLMEDERLAERHQFSEAATSEIEADLVALALMARVFDGAEPSAAYRALSGSVLALIAATHVNEHWLAYDATESHPPLMVRLWFLFAAADAWFADLPVTPEGAHPLGYAAQLRVFAEALATHWIGGQYEEARELNAGLSDAEYEQSLARRLEADWVSRWRELMAKRSDE